MRDILTQQLVRVLISPFVRPRLFGLDRLQIHGSQLCVGHVNGLAFIQPPVSAQSGLVLQVVLPQLIEDFSSVHIVFAILNGLLQLRCCQPAVNVEVHFGFLNRDAQVGFNSFQRDTVLAVIHQVKAIEEHSVITEKGNIPAVNFFQDDKVIDLLDRFRVSTNHYRLENVVVIVLVVEAAQERVLLHKGQNCIIIIVNDGVLPGCQFLEYEQPVMCENLTVENECAVYHAFYLLSFVISIGELIGK